MQRSVSETKTNGEVHSHTALSPAALVQEQIWFQEQWTPKIGVYNIPTALRLIGSLDKSALRGALNEIVQRHESLRSVFSANGAGLSQILCEPPDFPLQEEDLSHFAPADRENNLQQRLRCQARQSFDLRKDLMVRASLFKLAAGEHVLFISMHHIASDEWSVRVFLNELSEIYQARVARRSSSLPELPIQYADFAAWQRERLAESHTEADLAWWLEELKGEQLPLDFPADFPPAPRRSYEGDRTLLPLGAELSARIQEFARHSKTTPFTVLLAAYQGILARYTGHHEILTGTAVAGREMVETEPLIGLFSNLLVIRTALPAESSFAQLVSSVREKTLSAFTHQTTPFDRLVAKLRPDRNAMQTPLVQSVFTLQHEILERTSWGELEVEWLDLHTGTSKFDLTTTAVKRADSFEIVIEFNTDLFEKSTIDRFLGHYRNFLSAALQNPDQPIWRTDYLSAPEKRLLLEDWNNTRTRYPRDETLHSLFQQQVQKTPEAVAVVSGQEIWTYRELNQRADELASTLRALGAGPEVMVGVCMQRSFELVLSLIAILKTGACYVPLDPDYPPERLEYMIRDTKAPLLLTQGDIRHKIPETNARVVAVHETEFAAADTAAADSPGASAENAAYVIYTSGSTGRPKGVIVTHRNVVRLVQGANYVSLGPEETILQYAPISFDASTFEIWGALLTGGKLCIMPPGRASLEELASAIGEFRVTTLWLTTGLFNVMVDEHPGALRSLRQMLTGGEAGSISHLRKFLEAAPQCRLIHCYGPTENTTFTTCTDLSTDDLRSGLLSIGRPISNTQVYILDEFLQPVPIGVPGELYTSGDGVARGYLNAPELTAERFIPHPFQPGERLYRTGDLARFLPDGQIQYLGRLDRQVKVRGFRIELSEIERELNSHPGIEDVVVIATGQASQEKKLVAYWVPAKSESLPEEELRQHLSRTLPEFMLPHVFMKLDALPLDPNGKVDRKALPAPALGDQSSGYAPPRNELETEITRIWQEALGLKKIGIHDNFFHLGGHSLLATQIMSRIKRALKLDVPLRTIFDHPTIASFAQAAAAAQADSGAGSIHRHQSSAEAEELLSRLDQLSDEEVAALLKEHSS